MSDGSEFKNPKKKTRGGGGPKGGPKNHQDLQGKKNAKSTQRYFGTVAQLNIGENHGVIKRTDDGKMFSFFIDGMELVLGTSVSFLIKVTQHNEEVAYNIQVQKATSAPTTPTPTKTNVNPQTFTPPTPQGDNQQLQNVSQLLVRLQEKDKKFDELIARHTKELAELQAEKKALMQEIKIAAENKAKLEQQIQDKPEPIYDLKKLQQLIPPLLASNKIAEAVDLVPAKVTLPDDLLFAIFKTLEYPRNVPLQTMQRIISIVKQRIKGLLSVLHLKDAIEVLGNFRTVVSALGKNINIRSIPSTTYALTTIFQSIEEFLPKTVPFAERTTFATSMQIQSYLSAFLTVMPRQVYRLLKLYKPHFEKIKAKEEERSKKIKEYSNNIKNGTLIKTPAQTPVDTIEDEEEPVVVEADDAAAIVENPENNQEPPSPIPDAEQVDEEQQKKALASIDYKSIDLEIAAMVKNYQQSQEERQKKQEMVAELSSVCNYLFDNACNLYMYGSSESNFGTAGCDVDLCLHFPKTNTGDANNQMSFLRLIHKALESDESPIPHIKPKEEIIRSRVPILKVIDTIRGIDCDMGIDNYLGVVNTRMLKTYSLIDERVQPFILAVKYWAKKRHINNPSAGSLSSYAFVLLALMYLQIEEIVPSLQLLAKDPSTDPKDIPQPHFVNAYDCRYFGNIEKLKATWCKKVNNPKSVGELIVGFFKYYASEFNYNKLSASIKDGRPIPKKSTNAIAVEDPFENRCLGGVVIDELAQLIVTEFRRAFTMLTSGGSYTDVTREREDYDDENIYRKRETYSEYITKEEAEKLIEQGVLYKGILRVNKKSKFHEAYVTVEGVANDFFIPGFKNRNRAIHGDIVAIQVVEDKIQSDDQPAVDAAKDEDAELQTANKNNPVATVVCILEKGSPRLFACKMMKQDDDKNKGFRWLCPLDKAYPRIMVRYEEFREVFDTNPLHLEEMLFIAEINYPWKANNHYPKGRVLGSLGLKKDLYAQKKAILLQNMPALYEDVYGQPVAQSNDDKKKKNKPAPIVTQIASNTGVNDIAIDIQAEVANGYRDYRTKRIFTIDPLTSRDLDDALSVEKLSENEFLITVFIADVTKIVPEGSPMDMEARRRATSVYMINQVEHMFDPMLSQNLCSILPGVTRFSIAVSFKMNQDAVIDETSIDFFKAIINSCVQLDYDSVQLMIEDKPLVRQFSIKNGFTMEQVKEDCLIMNKLAQIIRQKRRNGGSLFLHNREIEFKTNDLGLPTECSYSVHNESHELVEEFMLIANRMAGKATYEAFKEDAVLRCHTNPDLKSWYLTMSKLTLGAKKLGFIDKEFPLDQMLADKIPTQKIMNTFIEMLQKYPVHQVTIQQALLREMQLAKYQRVGDLEESSDPHYALNMSYYTHFTSPIRRYADMLVHRQIVAIIDAKNTKESVKPLQLKGKELSALVEHLNEYNYMAKQVDEEISRQYLAYYLSPLLFTRIVRTEAVIVSLGRRSFTVYIPKFCTEIQINVMRDVSPEPKSLKEVEHEKEDEPELPKFVADQIPQDAESNPTKRKDNVIIDSLTITWCVDDKGRRVAPPKTAISDGNTPVNPDAPVFEETSMELRVMKTILVDLDVDYESVPYDIYAYNVWELDCALTETEQIYQQPEQEPTIYARTTPNTNRRGIGYPNRGSGRFRSNQ